MKNYMASGWFYSPSQISQYIPSRITSLKPPQTDLENPWTILRQLDRHQWNMFFVGFVAWSWDSFDFFSVSVCLTDIAETFNKEPSAVSWGITITLMLRSVGALISGSLGDRFGRKWIMIANLFLFIVFELAAGFCPNLPTFLGVRALYGICMGGLMAPAAATSLEDLPYDACGILSGLYQQGYAVGYLLAAVFYRAFVPTTSYGWRSMFWFGAAPPVLIIIWRLCLPETNQFQIIKAEREARHAKTEEDSRASAFDGSKPNAFRAFVKEAGHALKTNWVLFVYMVLLMAGLNYSTHGSQDLYATFLSDQVGLGPTESTVHIVVGQIGCVIGSMLFGYFSSFFGRRSSIMVACVFGGALVPVYFLPRGGSLIAGIFFEQFFVGGVWGPIPIHLIELSPPALRSFFYGLTYQLGNLASSASSTIEATIGERFPLPPLANGDPRYNFGKVIGIFLGAVWVYILLITFVGPEMSQNERIVEEEAVRDHEEMRARGVSLAEIGIAKAQASLDGNESDTMGRFEATEDKMMTVHVDPCLT